MTKEKPQIAPQKFYFFFIELNIFTYLLQQLLLVMQGLHSLLITSDTIN